VKEITLRSSSEEREVEIARVDSVQLIGALLRTVLQVLLVAQRGLLDRRRIVNRLGLRPSVEEIVSHDRLGLPISFSAVAPVQRRIVLQVALLDSRDPDATRGNLRLHLLPAVLAHRGRVVSESAVVHLRQQRHHLRVQHRREQIRLQRGVSEPFLEAVALVISAL